MSKNAKLTDAQKNLLEHVHNCCHNDDGSVRYMIGALSFNSSTIASLRKRGLLTHTQLKDRPWRSGFHLTPAGVEAARKSAA